MNCITLHAAGIAALAVIATAHIASAHVTLEARQAPAASTYKAVFNVGHGCEGSPTTKIRIQIPAGVVGVKPMPKPGWEVTVVKGKLAEPYMDHGKTITEGVTEVTWSGGKLLDEHFDQFTARLTLPDRTGEIWFPVVQECEKGANRWIEIPAAGKSADDLKSPAARLVLPPKP